MKDHLFKIVIILATSATVVFSCSCVYLPQTDQERFCSFDRVFLAYVDDTIVPNSDFDTFFMKQYSVFVFHIARDTDNQLSPYLYTTINITTGANDGVCGVDLSPSTSYMLTSNSVYDPATGAHLWVGLCGWNVQATSLESSQIVGLLTWACHS